MASGVDTCTHIHTHTYFGGMKVISRKRGAGLRRCTPGLKIDNEIVAPAKYASLKFCVNMVYTYQLMMYQLMRICARGIVYVFAGMALSAKAK